MGQDKTIEEVLSDENISGLAVQYMQDPNFAEKIKKEEPEIAKFMDKYHAILQDAVNNIDSQVATTAKITYDNQHLGTTASGELSKKVMDVIAPGAASSTSLVIPPPLISALNDTTGYSDAARLGLKQFAEAMAGMGPEAANFLRNIPADQLSNYTDPNSSSFKNVINRFNMLNKVKNISLASQDLLTSTDQAVRAIGFNNKQEMTDLIGSLQKIASSGYGNLPDSLKQLAGLLPVNKPAVNWSDSDYFNLVRNIKQQFGADNGQTVPDFNNIINDLKTTDQTVKSSPNYATFQGYLSPNGQVNFSSLRSDIAGNKLDLDKVWNDPIILGKLTPDQQTQLITKYAIPKIKDKANSFADNHATFKNVQNLNNMFKNPSNIDEWKYSAENRSKFSDDVKDYISHLQTASDASVSPSEKQAYHNLAVATQNLFDKWGQWSHDNPPQALKDTGEEYRYGIAGAPAPQASNSDAALAYDIHKQQQERDNKQYRQTDNVGYDTLASLVSLGRISLSDLRKENPIAYARYIKENPTRTDYRGISGPGGGVGGGI